MLFRALRDGDHAALADGARMAVSRYAGIEPGRPVGGTYYLYRTLRNLDLDAPARASCSRRARAPVVAGSLAERLAQRRRRGPHRAAEARRRDEIRRRLVEDRGAGGARAVGAQARCPRTSTSCTPLATSWPPLHRALVPAQPQAGRAPRAQAPRRPPRRARPAPHRARTRCRPAACPITPIFKPPRPAKPEIFVIADVSGSVASFARFTLLLVHAISSQFRKVRSFVFVDGLDEVTRFFEETDDPAEAVSRINTEADVICVDGHSDYGRAL